MDIQAALKDGYKPEEVMAELSRRGVKMNYQQAIADGHDPMQVLEEMNGRETKTYNDIPSHTPGWKADTRSTTRKVVDYITTPPEPAKTGKEMLTETIPRSVVNNLYGIPKGALESLNAFYTGNAPKQLEIMKGLGLGMLRYPRALLGSETAQKEVLSDPVGSALAVSPLVKGGISGLGALGGKVRGGINPQTMELARLSREHNVPLTVGELRNSTGVKTIETQLERVPIVGTRKFRQGQSEALKNAASNLVDTLTKGTDDAGVTIQQSLLRNLQKGKDLAGKAYDQINTALGKEGVIDEIAPSTTRQAAKELLAEYPDIFERLPSGTVKSKLQIITEDTAPQQKTSSILNAQGEPISETVQPTMSFKDARALREQLGNYINRARKSAGAVGDKEVRRLSILKSAIDEDIKSWAENTPNAEVNNAFRYANKVYQDNVAPFKDFIVKKATGDAFDTDLMAKTFIKNDRPQLASKLMGLLDEEGRAAVKHSVLKEALDVGLETKSDVPFSPAKFARKLENYGNTLRSIFTPEELKQVNGFVKLSRAAERAGQFAENPPTGLRAGDAGVYIGGTVLAVKALPVFATTATAIKGLSSLLTSEMGRKLLVKSYNLPPNSPAWQGVLKQAGGILKDQRGFVEGDASPNTTLGKITNYVKGASRNQLETLKEELRDLTEEFRDIYTKRPAKGKIEPSVDKPFRRLNRLELMISTKAEAKNQPKTNPVKDFARGSKDAIIQEITDLRDELKDMFKGVFGE